MFEQTPLKKLQCILHANCSSSANSINHVKDSNFEVWKHHFSFCIDNATLPKMYSLWKRECSHYVYDYEFTTGQTDSPAHAPTSELNYA